MRVPETGLVAEITRAVWQDFLGMPLCEAEPGAGMPECTALIGIAGEWNGTVAVGCSRALARKAAAAMFHGEESTMTEAQWKDALNEVVNIIGGNVKSLLPGPSSLALPVFHDAWLAPDASGAGTVAFRSEGQALQVWVLPA